MPSSERYWLHSADVYPSSIIGRGKRNNQPSILEKGMAIKRIEHRASFSARSDDGTEYDLHYFVQIIDVGNSSAPNAEIDGLKTQMQAMTRRNRTKHRSEAGFSVIERRFPRRRAHD